MCLGSLTDVSVRDSRRTEPAPRWFEPNHPTEALASTKPKRVLPKHTEGGHKSITHTQRGRAENINEIEPARTRAQASLEFTSDRVSAEQCTNQKRGAVHKPEVQSSAEIRNDRASAM